MDVLKNVKKKWHLYRSVFLIFYGVYAMLQARVRTIDGVRLYFSFIEYRFVSTFLSFYQILVSMLFFRCRNRYHL